MAGTFGSRGAAFRKGHLGVHHTFRVLNPKLAFSRPRYAGCFRASYLTISLPIRPWKRHTLERKRISRRDR